MYQYWGFGLHISSEIEFPELLPYEFSSPDVVFRYGKTPKTIEGKVILKNGSSYIIADRELLFTVDDVARYYASGGDTVTIEPCESVLEMRTIRLYILATVMAGILTQRSLLPFHASAIIRDEALILITGDSQAGKSTSLAGLLKKGHTIFSDDILVLKKGEDNRITANASYPMIKLWDDTLDKLDHDPFRDRSFRVRHDLDKFGFFFHGDFNTSHYPLKKIFILKKEDIPSVRIKTLSGFNAFEALRKQVYRPFLLQSDALFSFRFSVLTELSKTCTVYEISRPLVCNPEELITHIETTIDE